MNRSPMKRYLALSLRWWCLLWCLILLNGCFSPVKTEEMNVYTLSPIKQHNVSHPSKRQGSLILLISRAHSAAGYDSNQMIYVTRQYQLASYAKNRWAAPPADMFETVLAYHLEQTGFFRHVVVMPYIGRHDYLLKATVITLRQEFLKPVSEVRFVVKAELVNRHTHRVVASRIFEEVQKAPGNDPYSGVLAANKASENIAQQIGSYMIKALKHQRR